MGRILQAMDQEVSTYHNISDDHKKKRLRIQLKVNIYYSNDRTHQSADLNARIVTSAKSGENGAIVVKK